MRRGGVRRRQGLGSEWFTIDEPQHLFDETEVSGAAATDFFEVEPDAIRSQLPLPPGGLLCLPLHAVAFSNRNECEIELAYGGGIAGAGSSVDLWTSVRSGWHRIAFLKLLLPHVRPGVAVRRVQVTPGTKNTPSQAQRANSPFRFFKTTRVLRHKRPLMHQVQVVPPRLFPSWDRAAPLLPPCELPHKRCSSSSREAASCLK